VPSDITVNLLANAIHTNFQGGKTKFLVDGFPRNMENLQGWDAKIGDSVNMPFVLFFDCAEEVMRKRLLGRAVTSGRKDDNNDSINKRFAVYRSETLPVIRQFTARSQVRVIPAVASPDDVFVLVRRAVAPIST